MLMSFSIIRSVMLAACVSCMVSAHAGNDQIVNAKGVIVNSAAVGSSATMNLSSNKGVPVLRGNRQITDVNGAILNSAAFGSRAELNIASKTPGGSSGSQVISIGGPVVNQATGGQTSILNIGSR